MQRVGQPGHPIVVHLGLWFQKMGFVVLAKVPGTGVGPAGQDGYGTSALTCFLIILSGPQVEENFRKAFF